MESAAGEADDELDTTLVVCRALHATDNQEVARLAEDSPHTLWIYLSPQYQQPQLVSVTCRDQLGGRPRDLALESVSEAAPGCWCLADLPDFPQRFTIQLDGVTQSGPFSAVVFVDPNTANVAFIDSARAEFSFAGFIFQVMEHQIALGSALLHAVVCLLYLVGSHPEQVRTACSCRSSPRGRPSERLRRCLRGLSNSLLMLTCTRGPNTGRGSRGH